MKNNPWKGLVPYEEKDLENYEFCGRTKAISKYYSLITNNLVSTLYGRTGCGKTSMLQAGIFPLLRQESYFPVICRLSLRNKNASFADYLIGRVEQEIANLCFSCKHSNIAAVNQVNDSERYKLWEYFYGHEFHGKDGNIVFPVIVLDQFEEVLINSKNDSLKFLRQISFLVGDDLLLPDDCYANFRVAISLREDFLYLLEDTIDEGKLQGLRDNRMRLTPLSIEEAEEIIGLGDDFFTDKERKQIYKEICSLAKNRREHISTNMLSLICSQIYQIYLGQEGKELVSLDDVKKLDKDPLRDFYKGCIKDVEKETVTFIENNLVLNGFRRPVTEKEFNAKVPERDRKRLTSGETKILQFITANDNDCVELIHDTLARTVFGVAKDTEAKIRIQKRRENNVKKYKSKQNLLTLLGRSLFNNSGFDFSEDNSRSIISSSSSKGHLKKHNISSIHSREYDGSDNVFIADILNQVVGGNNLSIHFDGKITKDGYYALGINTTVSKSQKIIDGIVFYGSKTSKEVICSAEGFCGIDLVYDSIEGTEKARIYKHSNEGVNISGVSRYEIAEYDDGLPKRMLFKDDQNKPCKHFDGNYGIEFRYNEFGNEIYRRYLDKDGINSCKIYNHIYGLKSEYNDDNDLLILQYFVDKDGNITEDAYDIVGVKYLYDEAGNNTRIMYIDKDKVVCMNPYGYSIINIEYKNGKVYKYSFHDVNGIPVNRVDGGLCYHVLEITGYDEYDRIKGYVLKDVDGKQLLKLLLFHDQIGRITDIKYYINDCISVNPRTGIHHVHYEYYLNGLMSSQSTYDINGNAIVDISGFFKAKFEYDNNGKLIKRLLFKQNTEKPYSSQSYEYISDDKCIMREITYKLTSDGIPLDIIDTEDIQEWKINHKFQATEIIFGENNYYIPGSPLRVKYKFNIEGDIIENRLFDIKTDKAIADNDGDYGCQEDVNKNTGEVRTIMLDENGNCSKNNHSYAIIVRNNDMYQGQECTVTTYFDEENTPVLCELGYHKIIESHYVDDELNSIELLLDCQNKPCNCIYGYSKRCFEEEVISDTKVKRIVTFLGVDGSPRINKLLGFQKREQIIESGVEISRCFYDEQGNLINVSEGYAKRTFKINNSFNTLFKYPFSDHCVIRFYDEKDKKTDVDFKINGKKYHAYKYIVPLDYSTFFKAVNAEGETLFIDKTILWKYMYIIIIPLFCIVYFPIYFLCKFFKKFFNIRGENSTKGNTCKIIKIAQVYNEIPKNDPKDDNTSIIAPATAIGLKEGFWIVRWNDWVYQNNSDIVNEFENEFNKKKEHKYITLYNPFEKEQNKCFINIALTSKNIGIRIVDAEVEESEVTKMLELKEPLNL